ncbi:MAG: hypothetical protein CNLJKLNK_00453 [Holosporales bacterium]
MKKIALTFVTLSFLQGAGDENNTLKMEGSETSFGLSFTIVPEDVSREKVVKPLIEISETLQQELGEVTSSKTTRTGELHILGRDANHFENTSTTSNAKNFSDCCMVLAQAHADFELRKEQNDQSSNFVKPKNRDEASNHIKSYLSLFEALGWSVISGSELYQSETEKSVEANVPDLIGIAKTFFSADALAIFSLLTNLPAENKKFELFKHCRGDTNFSSLCMGNFSTDKNQISSKILYMYYKGEKKEKKIPFFSRDKHSYEMYVKTAEITIKLDQLENRLRMVEKFKDRCISLRQCYNTDSSLLEQWRIGMLHEEEEVSRKLITESEQESLETELKSLRRDLL